MPIEVELGQRARELLRRRCGNGQQDARFDDLQLTIERTVDYLLIERISDYKGIYIEDGHGRVVRTSLEGELGWALDLINRQLVLDDLAAV
ncbi:MAG: hypothetical protein AB7V39_11845 [Nitrospiraceae bacterium]